MARTLEMRRHPTIPGAVRIHWLIFDEAGPITLPRGTVMTNMGPKLMGGSLTGQCKARIACEPKLATVTNAKGGIISLVMRSDDPRAANCPECMATEEYKAAMANLNELLPVGG